MVKRYQTFSSAERALYQGAGIGSTHCKNIVELHGGKIWMESVPGEARTFLFTIPEKTEFNGEKTELHHGN